MSSARGRDARANQGLNAGLALILLFNPGGVAFAAPRQPTSTETVTLAPSVPPAAKAAPAGDGQRLARSAIRAAYENAPLFFVPNQGQMDARVRFYEQSQGHAAQFTRDGMYLSVQSRRSATGGTQRQHVLKLTPLGGAAAPAIEPEEPQRPRINSFLGDDPSRWRSDLPTYGALLYRDVYPGIDIRFHGRHHDLEYDVIVHPGADPSAVRLGLQGITGLDVTGDGQLRMRLDDGELAQKPPHVFQEIDGREVPVGGRFSVHGPAAPPAGSRDETFAYGFEVGTYDRRRDLVIDPALQYSSYLGGNNNDSALAINVRPGGTLFVTGSTLGGAFPTTVGAYQTLIGGTTDAFVSKFDVTQSGAPSLVFSTFLGGANADQGNAIAVNSAGEILVYGTTAGGFPTTAGVFQPAYMGGATDAFLSKLNAAGDTLVYSTYTGSSGTDEGYGVAVDGSGFVYITGRSTAGPNGGFDVYVGKLNATATTLVWYDFLGGANDDAGNGIAVTPGGTSYVTGSTLSNNFTTTGNAFDATANGGNDAFVSVLNTAGTVTYSTYLGGAGSDIGRSIAVDPSGNAYVAGETGSNPFPTTAGAFDTIFNGGPIDAFVAKIDPSLSGNASLVWSTYLGGSGDDSARGIAYDGAGGVCVTGFTMSANFPTVSPVQAANAGGRDIFVAHLNPAGSALTFSTYFGGTSNDTGNGAGMVGNLCCIAGVTASTDYPVSASAFQNTKGGAAASTDACVTCISQVTTMVELMSFTATALDAAVDLAWQTGSELNNLGFNLYRSSSADGPYERINTEVIPGLGSSPEGASYPYGDRGLTNGVTYFYKLEDIDTTGKTTLHGPVSATPQTSSSGGGGAGSSGGGSATRVAYGDPSSVSLRILERSQRHALLELRTGGFYASRQADGSVVLEVPGMEELLDPGRPALPVRRAFVEAVVGRRVRLAKTVSSDVLGFPDLVPALSGAPEMVQDREGVVRARLRRAGVARSLDRGVFPARAARLGGTVFQGERKKALLELRPLRWDAGTRRLELARRLVVRLEFAGTVAEESSSGAPEAGRLVPSRLGRRTEGLLAQLAVRQRGLYAVAFEDLFRPGQRGVLASELRLGRQGQAVAFHVEPARPSFGPGSVLYFHTEGSSLNPYGNEAVYELSVTRSGGPTMPLVSASPSGSAVPFAWGFDRWEENLSFQPGLLDAPDLWLWESLIAPVKKSHHFVVDSLAATPEPSQLTVFLQGGSDEDGVDDHHVRVWVNGTAVGELVWDGKTAQTLAASIPAGLLHEGDNLLEVESLGDAGASYSLVFLDRFELVHPRALSATAGSFEASFSLSGSAEVSGLGPDSLLLDLTSATEPQWLFGASPTAGGISFGTEAGRQRLAVSPQNVLHPEVRVTVPSSLRRPGNRADYLLIGPRAFLPAAQPLLDLRQGQGLIVKAVAVEQVYQDFGHGEATPQAIRDFIAYAYHYWQSPSPRYVLLLGDASYDYKDFLHSGALNAVPPLLVKTSFLWTASDQAYAAVNGDDLMPDLALGRLPAATYGEAQALVDKVVAFEASGLTLAQGPAVLVADNPDLAGDFETSAQDVVPLLAASHPVETIFLSANGGATRPAIAAALDRGAALMSYLGHGGIAVWASENVFNNQDVATLAPQPRQPLLLTMDCLNGYFHFPFLNSLAEELLKAPDKGSIASFAPSGLSLHAPADLFHKALIQEIASGSHERLGDAVFAAQADFADTGAFPELLSIYNLLGDPALKIR
jgi:hypothetical protein